MSRRGDAAVVALLLIVAVSACGGEDGPREQQSRDETKSTETHETMTAADTKTERGATTGDDEDPLSGGKSCTNEKAGYTVRYPAEWHTNSGDVVAPCRFFHPEPFEVEPHTEVLDLAISIRVESVPFDRVTGEDPSERSVERQETTLDGRAGVRIEAEATGAALLPEGTRVYRYAFDLDGRTLVATTFDVEGLDYEENKRVLDAMVATIDLQ